MRMLTQVDKAEYLEYVQLAHSIVAVIENAGASNHREKVVEVFQYGYEIARAKYSYLQHVPDKFEIVQGETTTDRLIRHKALLGVQVESDGTHFVIKHTGIVVDRIAMSPTGKDREDHDDLLAAITRLERGDHKTGLANRKNPNKSAIERAKKRNKA